MAKRPVHPVQQLDAQHLAHQLMDQHGLTAQGWRFAWGHGKQKLGATEVRKRPHGQTTRTIRLSRHLAALNDASVVRDVILHEIAHALVGIEHGHNDRWKAVCRRIGAKPQRLAGKEVQSPPPPYALVCGVCHETIGRRHRRISPQRLARAYCRNCGPPSTGKLQLQLVPTTPAP